MKLDKRVKENALIGHCFNAEEMTKYIGQECYFADNIATFGILSNSIKRVLVNVDNDREYPYETKSNDDGGSLYYSFCLPTEFVEEKPKETKYIPFKTTHDLADAHLHLGYIINFVNTKFLDVVHRAMISEVTYDDNTEELIDITLGNTTYSFESLVNDYQFLDNNDTWVPFGKKVEK